MAGGHGVWVGVGGGGVMGLKLQNEGTMSKGKGFGHVAAEYAGEFEDPDKPQQVQRFADPEKLACCIDLILPTALNEDRLLDLPRRLQESANTLADERFRIDEAHRAVKEIAECFENYLQLIAILKYPARNDLLVGNDVHRGFFHTTLGGLLHGRPDPQPGKGPGQAQIPTARVVTYNAQGNGRRDRLYKAVKRIRNKIHSAQPIRPYQVLHDARLVLAAYLFATEENAKLIANKLYPHQDYLANLIRRLRLELPFVIEPELERHPTDKGTGEDTNSLGERTSFEKFEETALKNCSGLRFAIYGDPGAGKTTFMCELACRLAATKRRSPLGPTPLPVLIEANRYTGQDTFKDLIAAELEITVEQLPEFGRHTPLVILVDGLNEVPAQAMRRATAELSNLSTQWRGVGFVLTSRFPKVFQLLGFRRFRLIPFDDRRVREFIAKSLQEDRAREFSDELRRLPRLLELCRNPLLLHMLVELSSGGLRIPKNRGKLLHGFMTRFLEREEPQITPVSAPTMRLLLSRLAFEMRSRKVVALPSAEVEQYCQTLIRELQSGVGAVDAFSAIRGAKLLHAVGDARVAFFHELIQEYFAALELLRRLRSDELDVASLTLDDWWHEVVVLAYGLAEDDRYLFDSMAANDLTLLARAVMDAPEPDAERQAEVVERAATVIEDGKPRQGRALEALAIVWNEEAMRRAAIALRSRSQVTDFVERFTRDPFEVALDLLQESPTGAVVVGVSAALRRTSREGTQNQLRELFVRSVELIIRKADGRAGVSSYEPLVQIALLGIAPPENRMLRDGISALLDVQQALWAYRLVDRYASSHQAIDASLSKRLVRELILNGVPHGSCLNATALRLTQDEWRSLQWLALANEAYDWVVGLAKCIDGPQDVSAELLRQVAHRVVRVGGGRDVGKVIQGIAGRETASRVLRSMLSALEIPPHEVGGLTAWLGDPNPIRSCLNDYFRLAVRQRCGHECYSQLARWAHPGDLTSDLAGRQVRFLHENDQWEAALLVLYAANLKEKHPQLIKEAQTVLHPDSATALSPYWTDLVYNKFWSDWSEGFRRQLLSHAERHAAEMVVGDFGRKAIEALRSMVRNKLRSLETVVSRSVCELAGLGEEASRIVKSGIVEVIDRHDAELALDMTMRWGLATGDLDLTDAQYAAVQQAVKPIALRLLEAGEIRQAFYVCEVWDVDPQEALSSIADLSSGDAPAAVVLAGLDEGVFALAEVEAWFLARVRRGEVGQALSLRRSELLRGDLHGTAVLAVLELFENLRYKEAGQIIAAFELQDDFRAELEDIIPHLVVEGKTGVAEQLVQTLGPRYSAAFGDLILETAKARLEQGEILKLMGLLHTTGMKFLQDEFKPVLAQHVEDSLRAHRMAEIREIMMIPDLASMIDPQQLLVRALERSGARVAATVKTVKDASYAFATLSIAKLRVFVHSSVLADAKMTELKPGSRLVLAIKADPKGLAAAWATVASGSDSDVEPVREIVATGEDTRSLVKLRDAWGARLKDAR